MGYSPWGHKELETPEPLRLTNGRKQLPVPRALDPSASSDHGMGPLCMRVCVSGGMWGTMRVCCERLSDVGKIRRSSSPAGLVFL